MRIRYLLATVGVILGCLSPGRSENVQNNINNAVNRSALDQRGTKPFHLKATVVPSFERDTNSGRTGEIEIWWASPTQWKREVRSPEFHQIEIVNEDHHRQKNEGDYFPEWLRNIAVELVNPIPNLAEVLGQAKTGEILSLRGQTNLNWTILSTDGNVQKGMGASIALNDDSGLLFYGSGLGWGAEFQDYKDFHGRMVAQIVKADSPEVTARVTTLEDLGEIPSNFFDADAKDGDSPLMQTVVIDEVSVRKNLLQTEPGTWPPLQDGPLEGVLTTAIVIDRSGRVRDIGTIVTDNPGVSEAARTQIAKMQFKPYLLNGLPVQVVSRITMPFRTTRPAGVETFDSARSYFEHGRHAGFPSNGTGSAYVLRAEFESKDSSGKVDIGRYEDTWVNDAQWKREAWFGTSHYVRSRNGEKRYELAEGPAVGLLRLLFKVMEPIPATDTFVESDWRIKRDAVDGTRAVRVLTGYESPDGKLDSVQVRGYWFDDNGRLLKTYFKGLETRRSDFQTFNGVEACRHIDVLRNGALGMPIHVTEISPAGTAMAKNFELKGHEYTRSFTDEVR